MIPRSWLSFVSVLVCFFFKQKTAYEMRISDWSSDVCSSDLSCLCDRDDPHLAGSSDGQPVRALSPARLAARRARSLVPDPRTTTAQRAGNVRACEIGRASCRERGCQDV